jgi:hypothetical protein
MFARSITRSLYTYTLGFFVFTHSIPVRGTGPSVSGLKLVEDPEVAMQEAAFPEVCMLTEINERIRVMPTEEAEAVGHVCPQRAYTPSQPFSLYLTHPVLETGSDVSTPQ